jgi:hypothetical protein
MLHNIITVSVRVFHVFFPCSNNSIRNAFPRQTACRQRSTLMNHEIDPEAVHDVDVGESSAIMDMRIPKVLSTRRKNVLWHR